MIEKVDRVCGDTFGLAFPAHREALQQGGAEFLTHAFHASGALAKDNSVRAITHLQEIEGGSTGRKAVLQLQYAAPSADLHENLFIKFSRDFDSELRDAARVQMEREVLFAIISSDPDFPVVVPKCYFSDFHHESGTGILITEQVFFGRDGVEQHYKKSLDYLMPDAPGHYRALVRTLARLAGTHKAGRLSSRVEEYFPFEPDKLVVSQRKPYTPEQIGRKVAAYADFAGSYPQLLPENIRSHSFIERLAAEAPEFQALVPQVKQVLQSNLDTIALCHWNAHVDNAWFWRSDAGDVECGLMDWGNVSQMDVAMALWGCLSAAELDIWDNHLDELLRLFVDEFRAAGGGALDVGELKFHLVIYVAMMGLAWMLDAVKLIPEYAPQIAEAQEARDPLIQQSERARSQLLIMTVFLNLWEKENMAGVIETLKRYSATC